jgi:hypothetical protein
VLDGLKARLDQLLREHGSTDSREYAAGMRDALIEAKVGLARMSESIEITERELVVERKHLDDAERRARLAAGVSDQETVTIAERFAGRHRDRILILERKLVVQRDELVMAQREIDEMAAEMKKSGRDSSESLRAAWRDLEAAGATRPDDDARAHIDAEKRRLEEAIEAQLAYLKKKLGKQP